MSDSVIPGNERGPTSEHGICKNCLFWKQKPDDETAGECRRYAPRTLYTKDPRLEPPLNQSMFGVFSHTFFNDWCGDFRHENEISHLL